MSRFVRWPRWLSDRVGVTSTVASAVALSGVLVCRAGLDRASGTPSASPAMSASWAFEAPVLHVPRALGGLVIDGDTDDPGWSGGPEPARTGAFTRAGGAAGPPYSEARFVWQDRFLYIALYAADEDIRSAARDAVSASGASGDAFRLAFSTRAGEYVIDVSPAGVSAESFRPAGGASERAWASGAHVAVERDGTVDEASDMDEEWLVEMAVPFASLGMRGEPGESAELRLQRCDAPAHETHACAGWGEGDAGGRIVLE